jgi:hypothetical protein
MYGLLWDGATLYRKLISGWGEEEEGEGEGEAIVHLI